MRAQHLKAGFLAVALGAVVAVVAARPAGAVNPTETVKLRSIAGSKVTGTATVDSEGEGTGVALVLRSLAPRAAMRAVLRAVLRASTCTRAGASAASIASARADAKGSVSVKGKVLFRGTEPVSFTTVGDGRQLVSIVAGGKLVACGVSRGTD